MSGENGDNEKTGEDFDDWFVDDDSSEEVPSPNPSSSPAAPSVAEVARAIATAPTDVKMEPAGPDEELTQSYPEAFGGEGDPPELATVLDASVPLEPPAAEPPTSEAPPTPKQEEPPPPPPFTGASLGITPTPVPLNRLSDAPPLPRHLGVPPPAAIPETPQEPDAEPKTWIAYDPAPVEPEPEPEEEEQKPAPFWWGLATGALLLIIIVPIVALLAVSAGYLLAQPPPPETVALIAPQPDAPVVPAPEPEQELELIEDTDVPEELELIEDTDVPEELELIEDSVETERAEDAEPETPLPASQPAPTPEPSPLPQPAPRPRPAPAPKPTPVPMPAPVPKPPPVPKPAPAPAKTWDTPPLSGPRVLRLKSDPAAMRVVFDGVAFGVTPMTIEVPEGKHSLKISDGANSGSFSISGGKGPSKMCFVVSGTRLTTGKCP